ncbi:MAG TPA: ABC transporter permease subunit [Blastocatellia bacterium]|nr:ABC transporter permease subunit [Blastocatellia bacterium]
MEFYNPILIKEMRTRMRGKLAISVLTIYVVTLSLLLGLIFLVITKNAPSSVANQSGRVLTPVLIYVQMSMICLIAPVFSATAISSERREQTFDLLVVSLARSTTIVFGKVGGSLSYLLLTLFGSLPLIALTYSFGGVDLGDVVKAYLVMLTAGVTFCSLSFLWSTLIRRSVLAILTSLITVIFLVAAMPALALFFSALAGSFQGGPSRTFLNMVDLLLRTNPFAAIASLMPGLPPIPGSWLAGVPIWICQVIFYVLLTVLSLFLSYRRLQSVRNWI